MLSADEAARLTRRAARRHADGSRGLGARWAWRRLVRACAGGDPAAQDAVRAMASDLPDADVLDLLAAAPDEPADRAAYLALIGQDEQRQAMDPDGSLLALAYRAAASQVRERLRTILVAGGDTGVIRVVVTGDQRDRIAEMSGDELDHLAHRLAEHRRWDEVRRLARDLPPAEAVATAVLLPERERTGDDTVALLTAFAERSSEELRATVDRLPRDRLIAHRLAGPWMTASFSPDAAELALKCGISERGRHVAFDVETLRLGTGETTHLYSERSDVPDVADSMLHLGNEILIRLNDADDRFRVVRVMPDHRVLDPASATSDMRRASRGATMLHPEGLAFADPGADRLRYEPYPRFSANQEENRPYAVHGPQCTLTTLPGSGLVAFVRLDDLYVVHESRKEIIHHAKVPNPFGGDGWHTAGLSFLSPQSLALHHFVRHRSDRKTSVSTEIVDFPPQGEPCSPAGHEGTFLDGWPLTGLGAPPIDDSFAARLLKRDAFGGLHQDLPWLRGAPRPDGPRPANRDFLALSSWGDVLATTAGTGPSTVCEVHSPHLPSARELLERPLLHSTPQDLRRVRELRAEIGDPAVRDALDLLENCLVGRFGGEIALSDGTGRILPGGATDIALGEDRAE